ncbi:hypothetical protein EV182_007420, partial [Spiromyces aspiralis]
MSAPSPKQSTLSTTLIPADLTKLQEWKEGVDRLLLKQTQHIFVLKLKLDKLEAQLKKQQSEHAADPDNQRESGMMQNSQSLNAADKSQYNPKKMRGNGASSHPAASDCGRDK